MSVLRVALVLGVIALCALVLLGLRASRRRTLTMRVGSFECALVRPSRGVAVSVAGTCQYGATSLYWWRDRSLAPRPEHTWTRSGIVVVERSPVDADLAPDRVAVLCEADDESFELIMSRDAYAGLRSWIEAAPPAVNQLV